jgi:CAAD domains of cyanobacterial aminoacyl-tRNA synthetase
MSIDLTTEISRIDEHDPNHVETPKAEEQKLTEAEEYDNAHVENSTVENMAPMPAAMIDGEDRAEMAMATPELMEPEMGDSGIETKLANESAVTPDLDNDAMKYDQKSLEKSAGEVAASLHSSETVLDNEYAPLPSSMGMAAATPATSDVADDKSITESAKEIWQSLQSNNAEFLTNAKSSVTDYYQNNRQLFNWLGLTILAFVSLKLLFAGLNAVDSIPLMSPILKVVGLFYTVRFVSRYVIREQDRQELMQAIDRTKAEIFGSQN